MKKHLILAGVFSVAIVQSQPAMAVTKCVALNGSTTCTHEDPGNNVADWTSTCTTNGVRTPIKGIGICSANAGSAKGATATELEMSSTADDNLNCWCKMVSPAVSRWVSLSPLPSAGNCALYCARNCASLVNANASVRSALFSSLSD